LVEFREADRIAPDSRMRWFGPMVGASAFDSQIKRVLEGLRLARLPD
jgi:hypothetical protein